MPDLASEIVRVLEPDYGPGSVSALLKAFHADAGVSNGAMHAFYAGEVGDQSLSLNDAMWSYFTGSDPTPLGQILLTEDGDYLTTEDGVRLTTEAG